MGYQPAERAAAAVSRYVTDGTGFRFFRADRTFGRLGPNSEVVPGEPSGDTLRKRSAAWRNPPIIDFNKCAGHSRGSFYRGFA